jgi:acyl-CoA synthetase (NDP forming)
MLETMFNPASVAVVGATEGASATGAPRLGAAALEHLIAHGFKGAIYPVNPKRETVMGLKSYPDLGAIPGDVALALILLPAEAAIEAMAAAADKGVKAAVVFSSGFAEAGEEALQTHLVEAAAGRVRFCGPNTAGLAATKSGLTASISMVCMINPFRAGDVAFITQSGALGGSMLARGMEDGTGFSHWISTGNEADLTVADYMVALVDDPAVRVLALFLEGVRDGRHFLQACERAAAAGKPIVVYKTGRSAVSAAAAASHTGALAGSDRVFDAVCRQYGLIRVDDAADLLPLATAFSSMGGKLPQGRRVGIVSASGGICGVAADDCARFGLEIPELPAVTQDEIRRFVPAFAAVRNPIDVTGQIRSSPTGYQDTVRAVLADDTIDGVLLLVTMAGEPRASFYGEEIPKLAAASNKPVIVGWTGGISLAQRGYPMLQAGGVPTYLSASAAVKAMSALADYGAFQRRRAEAGT